MRSKLSTSIMLLQCICFLPFILERLLASKTSEPGPCLLAPQSSFWCPQPCGIARSVFPVVWDRRWPRFCAQTALNLSTSSYTFSSDSSLFIRLPDTFLWASALSFSFSEPCLSPHFLGPMVVNPIISMSE